MVAASMEKPTRRVPPFLGVSWAHARRAAPGTSVLVAPASAASRRKSRRDSEWAGSGCVAAIPCPPEEWADRWAEVGAIVRLEPALVDLEAEPVAADQLVIRHAGLPVPAQYMGVPVVTLGT